MHYLLHCSIVPIFITFFHPRAHPHKPSDLWASLITSAAEVPALFTSMTLLSFFDAKIAFAVPMGLIAVALLPTMAGACLSNAALS